MVNNSDQRIKLVAFDLDGVLLDTGSSWVTVHRHFKTNNNAGLEHFLEECFRPGELTGHPLCDNWNELLTPNLHDRRVLDAELVVPQRDLFHLWQNQRVEFRPQLLLDVVPKDEAVPVE